MTYSTIRCENENETITVFGEALKGESSQHLQAYWRNKDESITAYSELKGTSGYFYDARVYVIVDQEKEITVSGRGDTIPEAEADCRKQLEELSKKAKKLVKKGL
jgi:hypothetical protein